MRHIQILSFFILGSFVGMGILAIPNPQLVPVPAQPATISDSLGQLLNVFNTPSWTLAPQHPVPAQPATFSDSLGPSFNVFHTPSWTSSQWTSWTPSSQPAIPATPAQPISDCTQCWCQCKSLSYQGAFNTIEGNCNR